PVTPALVDSRDNRIIDDSQANSLVNTFRQGYVNVTGNLEVIVVAFFSATETFRLSVTDVPSTVRGGVLYFGADHKEVRPLTAELRGGTTEFQLAYGSTLPSLIAPASVRGSDPDSSRPAAVTLAASPSA